VIWAERTASKLERVSRVGYL